MEDLKILHAKIEKKSNNILRAKRDLITANSECIVLMLKDFIDKNKTEKELLQNKFDEIYKKFN